MPTYEYICHDCGNRYEHFQSMSSPSLSYHPGCKKMGKNVERLISGGTGLIFKGSGFYLTDYKNKVKNPKIDKNKKDSANGVKKEKNKSTVKKKGDTNK